MEITSQTNNGSARKKDTNDAKENLWSEILADVQNQGSTKLPSNKSVLVLGDNSSGKTTLIAKLQGVEDPKKGSGLEYAYIDVRDEYRDDLTRLGVWVLDGDPGHSNLLKFALNESNYAHTLVILTVSMTSPWSWLDQLQNWMKVLADHVDQLKIDSDDRQEARQRLVTAWQNYCETGDHLDPSSPIKRSVRIPSVDDEDVLPLPDGAFTTNIGLDMVVVVTKTDYMTTLEKEYDYKDEHFDFMQQWIRRFCLQHGASLFYTSVKEDKNCDLLYKYLTHRIYDLPFRTPALVVEKDAVLIPSGWDNMNKISILHENMQTCKPDDYYTDVITAPPTRKTVSNREVEVQTEDEQAFLARQQQLLMQGQSPSSRGESPMRTPSGPKSTPRTPIDGKLSSGTPGGEGVLANFFNSLLNKKAGSPGGSPNAGASPRSINGKGGSKIKEIRDSTGCSVQVASEMLPNSTERAVTLSGSAGQITQCIYNICCVMLESPPKGATIPYRPKPQVNGPVILANGQAYTIQGNYAVPTQETCTVFPLALAGGLHAGISGLADPLLKGTHLSAAMPPHHLQHIHDMSGLTKNPLASLAALGLAGMAPSNTGGLNPTALAALAGSQLRSNNQSRGQPQQQTNQQQQEMTVPNDLIGCIIGKGGTKIAEIRHISGAMIRISNCEEREGGNTDRTITISGNPDSVALAQYLINMSVELQKANLQESNNQSSSSPSAGGSNTQSNSSTSLIASSNSNNPLASAIPLAQLLTKPGALNALTSLSALGGLTDLLGGLANNIGGPPVQTTGVHRQKNFTPRVRSPNSINERGRSDRNKFNPY